MSVEEKSLLAIDPAPDGGLRAWLQVLVGHLMVFNAWGYINSFGIFQSYYANTLNMPASTISWIGSFQVFLVFFIGTFSGRALDAGYYRHVAITGTLLQALGVFLTSLCTKYWQLFLAQGVCQGIGDGLIFCPTVSLVATYFSSRRAFAISTAASGAATGGIVFPLIAQQLLTKIGFAWTIRVMGLVVVINDVIILGLARTRLPPRRSGPLIELAAFKERSYLLFTIGMWFVLWATYYAYYYVSPAPFVVNGQLRLLNTSHHRFAPTHSQFFMSPNLHPSTCSLSSTPLASPAASYPRSSRIAIPDPSPS